MRTLSRYFVARFVQFFAAVLIIATVSLVVVELMLNLDRMLAFGEGPRAIFDYLWLRLASEYASYVVPIAAFVAAFATAAMAAYARETVATKAGGIAPDRLALPIVACGLALAAGFALFHETVVVEARREWNRQRDGDETISFERGSFWYHRGSRIYNVAEADRASRTLHDVRIFDRDERGRLQRSIVAAHIEILDGQRWRFLDAVVRDFDPQHPEAGARTERLSETVMEMTDPRDRALLSADPAALPLARLQEFITERERRGGNARAQRAILHERIADWIAVALLVAIALPLGLGVEQTRNLGKSAAYAVGTLSGYYALRNLAAVMSLQGVAPPAVAHWTLLAVIASAAALLLARTPR